MRTIGETFTGGASHQHKRRDPTRTEELIAHAYKWGYRHNFSEPRCVEQVEQYVAAWSYELVGQMSIRENFPCTRLAGAIGITLGLAMAKVNSFDEFMRDLKARLPQYNLNFPL